MKPTILPALLLLVTVSVAEPSASPERWAVAVFPSGAEFSLEIADDPVSRSRGYMFREEVGPEEGMLFIFEGNDYHGIWMKNCRVPLDIIWLDDSFRVVAIAPDQPPCTPGEACPPIVPMVPATFVIEVAGGITATENLRNGDRITILSDSPLAP